MSKYTVEVEMRSTEFWEVEASSPYEAESKWANGEARFVRTSDAESYDTDVTEGWDEDDDA